MQILILCVLIKYRASLSLNCLSVFDNADGFLSLLEAVGIMFYITCIVPVAILICRSLSLENNKESKKTSCKNECSLSCIIKIYAATTFGFTTFFTQAAPTFLLLLYG